MPSSCFTFACSLFPFTKSKGWQLDYGCAGNMLERTCTCLCVQSDTPPFCVLHALPGVKKDKFPARPWLLPHLPPAPRKPQSGCTEDHNVTVLKSLCCQVELHEARLDIPWSQKYLRKKLYQTFWVVNQAMHQPSVSTMALVSERHPSSSWHGPPKNRISPQKHPTANVGEHDMT